MFNFNKLKNVISNGVKDLVEDTNLNEIKNAVENPNVNNIKSLFNNNNQSTLVQASTTQTNNTNQIIPTTTINTADEYTEVEIFGNAKLKFKLANPTYFWNSNDNCGAAEIDTVYVVSKNGAENANALQGYEISGITFQTSDDVVSSETQIKNNIKNWFMINNTIVENINHNVFSKHVKAESDKVYYESYSFSFNNGEFDVYYSVVLTLYKNKYTLDECSKIVAEYHNIIKTTELIK